MNLKQHLQFLIMMIPTLLLVVAAVVTLAAPAKSAEHQPNINPGEVTVPATEVAPL